MEKHLIAIKGIKTPSNKDDVRRILGLVNFLRRYVKLFSKKTQPLYTLLKKDNVFRWTEKEEKALQDLKEYLLSNNVLKLPSGKRGNTFEFFTDASSQGIGGVGF